MAVIVRPVDLDREREELLAVLEQNLADLPHARRFKWIYCDNPEGPAWSWFVCDRASGRIHGVASVFRRAMWLGSRVSLCGQVGDFAIDADHRSLGPAVMLQRATFGPVDEGHLALCYDCPPHERGMSTFRRLGMKADASLVRHARLLRTDRRLVGRLGAVGRVLAPVGNALLRVAAGRRARPAGIVIARHDGRFDEEFSVLDRAVAAPDVIRGRRSAVDLNWRYRDDPLNDYVVLTARRRAELIGFVVLSVGAGDMVIVDLFGDLSTVETLGLLEAAADEARATGAETLHLSVSDGGRLTPHLHRAGFHRREEGPRVVAYAASRGGAAGSRDAGWRWDLTQSDVMV
jgi:hypothetical protein